MTNEINNNSAISKLKSIFIPKVPEKKVPLPPQKPDSFEHSQKAKEYDEEMSGTQFKSVKIQFYPEDIEKMKTMSHKEKMAYLKKLRQENRYVEVNE